MTNPRSALPPKPIPRRLLPVAEERMQHYPVLTITGPRQSGKTTLARLLRPDFTYLSLENPDIRSFAEDDPRGFLVGAGNGAILDEIQRAPQLLSYLQGIVDDNRRPGQFILTGSSQFELLESVTQSLAGRTSLLTLLPFSLDELQPADKSPDKLDTLLQQGLFPPIHDRKIPAEIWHQDYIATYVERDIRTILNIKEFRSFQRFVELCAGRSGQLLNLSSLAADTGINRATAQSWLHALQASHLVFLATPWTTNLSKRLIKSPKLYFCDCGLAAWLLGIRSPSHLRSHPQRGALFETWVMSELLKAQCHQGQKPALHFLRDKQGHEIDAIIEISPGTLQAIEMKSGATLARDHFAGLEYWSKKLTKPQLTSWLVYGGTERQTRRTATALPWQDLQPLFDQLST